MSNSEFEGGCPCGAVRYRMESKPMIVHCCHCTDCQRQTGGPFAVNALIEDTRVTRLSGELAESRMPSASGNGVSEVHCAACHGTLWLYYEGMGRRIAFIRTGTLDEPAGCPPGIHIYTRSKQDWVRLTGEIPAVSAYYDRKTVWPVDSLERRAALKKR